jgi:hypothetical protein
MLSIEVFYIPAVYVVQTACHLVVCAYTISVQTQATELGGNIFLYSFPLICQIENVLDIFTYQFLL